MITHRFTLLRPHIVLVLGLYLISAEMGRTQTAVPVLCNLKVDPSELVRPSGSNVYLVHLTFDYFEADTNITTLMVTTVDPEKSTATIPIHAVTALGIRGRTGKGRYQVAYRASNQLGVYEYRLQLVDGKGNKSQEASVSVNLLKRGAPRLDISKLTPSSGKAGDIIVMKGVGFNSSSVQANAVSIGGVVAEVKDVSLDKIVFVLPADAVTSPVTVSNTRGVAFSRQAFEAKSSIQIFGNGQGILAPLKIARFTAVVTGLADKSVQWRVNGIERGSNKIGMIDKAGTYTAPAIPPASGNVEISAVANARRDLIAKARIQLCPVLPITGPGLVNAQTGGYVQAENGLLTLDIPPAALKSDLTITTLKAEFIRSKEELAGIPADAVPIAKLEIRVANEMALLKPVKFRLLLPMWTPPGTEHKVMYYDGRKYVDSGSSAKVGADGTSLHGSLSKLGVLAAIVGKAQLAGPPPTIQTPEVTSIRVPVALIEEGLTLPVLFEGKLLRWGYPSIHATDPALNPPNGPLEFGLVFVSPDGKQLGFTLRIKPIETLHRGQSLPVSFRIDGLFFGPIITDPNMFIIRGLPELDVHQEPANNLYTIDGTHIDKAIAINDVGRYSRLVVDSGAVLGIGREVGNVMNDGITWRISTVNDFENVFGRLSWITDNQRLNNSVRLFQPENHLVSFDVTGPVSIMGTIHLAGMHGGENPRLDSPMGPGFRRLGGFASTMLSGGAGGDGGVTMGTTTNNGQRAGNDNTPDLGIGRIANGRLLQTVQPAGFGSRFDRVEVEYSSYFGLLGNIISLASTAVSPPEEVLKALKDIIGGVSGIASEVSNLSTTTNLASGHIVSGQGGHGGLRPTNGVPTMDEIYFIPSPGSGGGGGGGGGSSSYTETLFGITLLAQQEKGGGGAGGGGAAGALRITTSSKFEIDLNGRIDGAGGRGGFGEPHRSLGSPSGGGGGGAGGVFKLQSSQLINRGVIDLSGGERSGAIVAQSDLPAPYIGRIQMLSSFNNGGFLYYGFPDIGINPPTVKALWPTGRLRAEIPLSFATGIRGIGKAAEEIPFLFGPLRGCLLMITDDMRVVLTSTLDYLSGNPQFIYFGELLNLRTIRDSRLFGFIPTDVAQSPFPPYHIFISGINNVLGLVAESEIHEFDNGGNYLGLAFSITTNDDPHFVGHLREIDFLSDRRLAGLMATGPITTQSGIYAIDLTTGAQSVSLIHRAGREFASMSVFRGKQEDLIYVVHRDLGTDIEPPFPSPTIRRYTISGQPPQLVRTSLMAFVGETISSPGEPGLVRLDGSFPGSKAPRIAFDGIELPDLRYPPGPNSQAATFNSPTIGSFSGPAGSVTGLESLVFGQSQLTLFCQGGEPNKTAELKKMSDINPVPSGPTTPPADNLGQFVIRTQLDPGFNTVWVQTNVGGDTHDLLKRHVLYIKDANIYPPRF